MCKSYSGYGRVRGVDSRINFRPAGLEVTPLSVASRLIAVRVFSLLKTHL